MANTLPLPAPACSDDLNALPSSLRTQGYNGRDPRGRASHLFPDDPILLGITMRHDDRLRPELC